MSLPSWLKNAMGSPNLAQQQASPLTPTTFGSLGQAIGVSPYNGDPNQGAKLLHSTTHTGTITTPRYRARVQVAEVVSTVIIGKIVAALPPTAVIKIASVAITHADGNTPEVEIVFFSHPELQAREPLTLPLTAEFPTDADISRILLAMP